MTPNDITVALIILIFVLFGVSLFAVSTWVNLPSRQNSPGRNDPTPNR